MTSPGSGHSARCAARCAEAAPRLEAEDRAAEAPVAEEAQPAGVGGDVAAELAGALGAEVERYGEALLCESGVEGLRVGGSRLMGGWVGVAVAELPAGCWRRLQRRGPASQSAGRQPPRGQRNTRVTRAWE